MNPKIKEALSKAVSSIQNLSQDEFDGRLKEHSNSDLARAIAGDWAMSEDNTVDNVNAPKHYCSHPSGIECIQIAELLPFNLGSALKYLWRKGLKWDENEDVKKAIFYLRKQAALGKLPTYTAQECSQIKASLDCIKAVDVELYATCYIITLGTSVEWLNLANKLEAGL